MTASILGLEISPRMTGKTARLIAKARCHLDKDDLVRVVCSKGNKAWIAQKLPGALVVSDGQRLPSDINVDAGVWFYDEFDWLKSATLRPNAYYSTTPRFTRKLGAEPGEDLLLQLVQANGCRHDRYFWGWDASEFIQANREICASDEEFRRLCLGEFLE